jgi:periplasmic glucans biosynthesis protein
MRAKRLRKICHNRLLARTPERHEERSRGKIGMLTLGCGIVCGNGGKALRGMQVEGLDRRSVLQGSVGLAAALGLARAFLSTNAASAAGAADAVQPFSFEHVKETARKLAERDYVKPVLEVPEPFNKLSPEQYNDIRFKAAEAIWRRDKTDFELQLFPFGWIYDSPVEIWLAERGEARQLNADGSVFTIGPLIAKSADGAPFGFSGFRIHSPINRADFLDEYVVFQGASYFKAIGRDQRYGASARGLAINTARPGGEEFPMFRSFWIEKPNAGDKTITVSALLDSPSVAGAYRFAIQPGETTVMDVEATLYPRRNVQHVGIAPLTSMFLHSPADQRRAGDVRPAVHDSTGLAILNGNGERLWRPLTNPKTLQTSAFIDKAPKGFGLWQRERNFHEFEDLDGQYERRPTIWVEPKGAWGEGSIELIEIPVDDEIHNNIVAFWKPAKGLEAGATHEFQYRLHWGEQVPAAWSPARVAKTRIGAAKKAGTMVFVIDFDGPAVKELRDLPVVMVTSNPGTVANISVQRNPALPGVRVSFEMNPSGADLVELRLALKAQDQLISESWLYRWTKP